MRISYTYSISVVEVPSPAVDVEHDVDADAADAEGEGDRVLVETRRRERVRIVPQFGRLERVREGGQMRADALRREGAAALPHSTAPGVEVVQRGVVEHAARSVDQYGIIRLYIC